MKTGTFGGRNPSPPSTWQPPPALVPCSSPPLLPFFFQLPSYSLIIRAGGPDQSWHCHSPSQSLAQSFLLPDFCSLPSTSLKLQQKNFETGHWICQLLSLRIFLLIYIFFSCLIRCLPDYWMAHGESTVEKMGSAPARDTIWISMRGWRLIHFSLCQGMRREIPERHGSHSYTLGIISIPFHCYIPWISNIPLAGES